MNRRGNQQTRGTGAARRRRGVWLALVLAPLALLVLAPLAAGGRAGAAAPEGFRIIAHPQNAGLHVERAFLADAFLKKATRWPDGEAIYPVDQRPDAPVRERFSTQVLRRSVFAVRNYWQQRIFAGRGVPPPELESEEAVLRYVMGRRGAVGYVSEQADVSKVSVVVVH